MSDSDKKDTDEKTNAAQMPKVYYCRHMLNGLVGYENETILVDTDTIKQGLPSFVGKPVYVYHQNVDLENLQAQADGYVTEAFYNELDGWGWAKFLAVSDEAHKAVADGWSVSNAYTPQSFGNEGTHHNLPYDRQITDINFTHLAIVPNPRYELAKIYTPEEFKNYQEEKRAALAELKNSKETKQQGVGKMFNIFKTERKEVTSLDENVQLELQNGTTVTIKQMVEAIENAKKNEAEEKDDKEEKVNMDSEVEVGEEKMPLKELVNKYMELNAKKNADDEEKAKKEAEAKENADKEEADKKAEAEEKTNAKHFDELQNAALNAQKTTNVIEIVSDKLARGKERYSLKK